MTARYGAWLLALGACHGAPSIARDAAPSDSYEPVDATLAVNGLAFTPAQLALTWPDLENVRLRAHYTDDATMDVTIYATYESADPSIAMMAGGKVLPEGPGTTSITASYMGQTAELPITVTVRTLAVATPDGVDFFAASADGSAAPLRSLRGAATTLQGACGLATLAGELYVADCAAHAIDVWQLGASGDLAPTRRITTAFTPVSVAASGTSIYVGASDGVRVFDAAASGAASPTRTISGVHTTITSGAGVAVYQSELYVVNTSGSIAVFPILATGDVTPTRVMTGPLTGLVHPSGIAVGFGLAFVAPTGEDGSIQVFLPTSTGNALPAQVIEGIPPLSGPSSLALTDARLFVGTPTSSSIEVFAITANDQTTPLETIEGVNVQALTLF